MISHWDTKLVVNAPGRIIRIVKRWIPRGLTPLVYGPISPTTVCLAFPPPDLNYIHAVTARVLHRKVDLVVVRPGYLPVRNRVFHTRRYDRATRRYWVVINPRRICPKWIYMIEWIVLCIGISITAIPWIVPNANCVPANKTSRFGINITCPVCPTRRMSLCWA
jgi:hypothetical protein